MYQHLDIYICVTVKRPESKEKLISMLEEAYQISTGDLDVLDNAMNDLIKSVNASDSLDKFESANFLPEEGYIDLILEEQGSEGFDIDYRCVHEPCFHRRRVVITDVIIYNEEDILEPNNLILKLEKVFEQAGFEVKEIWHDCYFEDQDSIIERCIRDYDPYDDY